MGRHAHPKHDPQLRLLIAQTAARLMSESGIHDFALAKRKAAAQYGVTHSGNLPGNEEIEQALMEYQRLFLGDSQPLLLHRLRETALNAMTLLETFHPCLVGPVLNGSADAHSAIYLHLFADTPEQVLFFLMDRQIPHEQSERQVHLAGGQTRTYPKFSFVAGETPIELTVYPTDTKRQIPLSPIDGKPMKRADRKQLVRLLEENGYSAG
jgi:hypothetical protein